MPQYIAMSQTNNNSHIPKNRLEAFSDGVIAIIITIMVLELKVPHGAQISDLVPLFPVFLSYVLSFIFVGIYWNNHHHMLAAAKGVDGRALWGNLILLFFLSLIPFSTGWMGENHFGKAPTAFYGIVLLFAALAYNHLASTLIKLGGKDSHLAKAYEKDKKSKLSIALYVISIPLAFVHPYLSLACFGAVATLWLIPDARIEKVLYSKESEGNE